MDTPGCAVPLPLVAAGGGRTELGTIGLISMDVRVSA
jgi:hypothetical protein